MTGARGETSVVEREVRVQAAPETVFEFFTDPEKLVAWLGHSATLDPRPGGVFSVENPPGSYISGEYVDVTPYTRVAFTWGYSDLPGGRASPIAPGSSTVEVELIPDGSVTVVRLAHRAPAGVAGFHAAGWDNYLARLAVAAAGGTPDPDRFPQRFGARRPEPR